MFIDEFEVTEWFIVLDPIEREVRMEFVCQLLVLLDKSVLC
jgi:hypothetical protein